MRWYGSLGSQGGRNKGNSQLPAKSFPQASFSTKEKSVHSTDELRQIPPGIQVCRECWSLRGGQCTKRNPMHWRNSGDSAMGLLTCKGREGNWEKISRPLYLLLFMSEGELRVSLQMKVHKDNWMLRSMLKGENFHSHSGSHSEHEAEDMCGWVWKREMR